MVVGSKPGLMVQNTKDIGSLERHLVKDGLCRLAVRSTKGSGKTIWQMGLGSTRLPTALVT
jgi:hypothetical protein